MTEPSFNLRRVAAPRVRRDDGFTLAELLVVLTILAVLTTIAVQSLGPVADQSRYQATQRTLEQIKDAILSTQTSGNSTVVTGFVADNGRSPNFPSDNPFAELLTQPVNWPEFGSTAPAPPNSFKELSHGWHGPYLLTSFGGVVRDGWNHDFSVSNLNGVITITALPPATSGYTPIVVSIPIKSTKLTGTLYKIGTSGREPPTATSWKVWVIRPDSQTGDVIADPASMNTTASGEITYEIPDLYAGPRVVVAENGSLNTRVIQYINLMPGATQTLDLKVE